MLKEGMEAAINLMEHNIIKNVSIIGNTKLHKTTFFLGICHGHIQMLFIFSILLKIRHL